MKQGRDKRIIIFESIEELSKAAAGTLQKTADEAVLQRGVFTAVLSGGRTPARLYSILSQAPFNDSLPWSRTHIFWGDERCVPPSDPQSNFHLANAELLSRIEIPSRNIHRMRGEAEPQKAAHEYEKELGLFFKERAPVFDLVLLGLGADGHTLSLFPGSDALKEEKRLVVAACAGEKGWRLTLTANALKGARQKVFLVAGADKAGVLKELFDHDRHKYPASELMGGEVLWLVDREAGAGFI